MEEEVANLESTVRAPRKIDKEVDRALAGLDRLAESATNASDLGAVTALFKSLNANVFLRFTEVLLKKRTINKVAGGIVTFGSTPPPVPLYEGPTDRKFVKYANAVDTKCRTTVYGNDNSSDSSGREGGSLGNVSRGERI